MQTTTQNQSEKIAQEISRLLTPLNILAKNTKKYAEDSQQDKLSSQKFADNFCRTNHYCHIAVERKSQKIIF